MTIRLRRRFNAALGVAVAAACVGLTGCRNIDCPINNTVFATCGFYHADSLGAIALTDTLTVVAAGTDSVLFNRGIGIRSVSFPLSYTSEADTLLFRFASAGGRRAADTLFVDHDNTVHFENIDCPPAVFHHVRGVRWTSHAPSILATGIDSVAIEQPTIDYAGKENFKVYLRTR